MPLKSIDSPTPQEHDRHIDLIEQLLSKGEGNLSAEEDALLDLLTDLVHRYESEHLPIPSAPPHQTVQFLLEQAGLDPRDLAPVLGSRSRISEVLSGKRWISKDQANRLASFFHVGVNLFL